MGRRSKKKLTRAQHAPVPTAASPKDAHDDLPRLADYFWGLAVAAIFLAIKVIFIEHSAFGIKMERVGYELLQGRLGSHADAAAIIDISDLDQVGTSIEIEGGETKTLHVTPPDELRKIITTAAASEPRAIGVDINFAPYEAGTSAFLTPEHRELYDACLRANVPILLGIAAEQDAAPADRRRPDLFSRGP